MIRAVPLCLLLALALAAPRPAAAQPAPARETDCANRADDDGDDLPDCADNDCLQHSACRPDGAPEASDARCSDWVDNDSDGLTDCDDAECAPRPGMTVCAGSWDAPPATAGPGGLGVGPAGVPGRPADTGTQAPGAGAPIPAEVKPDADGERNDWTCSDGLDNDDDGRIDCADPGCLTDPSVRVCQGTPGVHFSVVATLRHDYEVETEHQETSFSRLQLRALGPLPMIENSFFLVSTRFEKTPRLTFALFQVPIGRTGHYFNVNSGGGNLSNALIRSAAKQLLIEAPFYMLQPFELGNSASVEVGGPLVRGGKLYYRAFLSGGAGRFDRDAVNYNWGAGAQLQVNVLGYYSRWDTPFIYVPTPPTLGILLGAKYDQRDAERFPSGNLSFNLRAGRVTFIAEAYGKRELEFKSWQLGWNVQGGLLVVPQWLLLAGDIGMFTASDFEDAPDTLPDDLVVRDELQWRLAAHLYYWRSIGVATLLYTDRILASQPGRDNRLHERMVSGVIQYWF